MTETAVESKPAEQPWEQVSDEQLIVMLVERARAERLQTGQVANRPICLVMAVADVQIRKVICSTNAIESVNARIHEAVRARGDFPSETAALMCVSMALMNLDPTGQGANDERCARRHP